MLEADGSGSETDKRIRREETESENPKDNKIIKYRGQTTNEANRVKIKVLGENKYY